MTCASASSAFLSDFSDFNVEPLKILKIAEFCAVH